MRLVIVESPYAAPTPEGIERNVRYARAAMRDCLLRGEAPYASHLLYTQPGVLRDEVPDERRLGMDAGFEWRQVAHATVVYTDLGSSRGVAEGVKDAEKRGTPVEYRHLGGEWDWMWRAYLTLPPLDDVRPPPPGEGWSESLLVMAVKASGKDIHDAARALVSVDGANTIQVLRVVIRVFGVGLAEAREVVEPLRVGAA